METWGATWRGSAAGEPLVGPRSGASVPTSLQLGAVGAPFYHPARACCLSVVSRVFGEKPLGSLSIQGSPALSRPLLWLARCESEEEVSGALSIFGTRAGFLDLWAASHGARCVSGAWWQSCVARAIWASSLQG